MGHQIWVPPSKRVDIIACCTLILKVAAPTTAHLMSISSNYLFPRTWLS